MPDLTNTFALSHIIRSKETSRLLRLWVRIPLGAWTFVCCECCVVR